jgi:hypothetical protein
VSWWPGDGNANDTLDGNDGTLQLGATFAAGMVGQAFSFDGIDDFVHVPNSPSLTTAGAYTIEFWFNPNVAITPSTSTSPGFFSKGTFDSINLANNDGRLEVRGPFPRPNSTTNTWLAGTWYHLAVTFDAVSYRIYVNGMLEGGIASIHSILNSLNDVALGTVPGFPPAIVTFNGLVDEVSLYNRALTLSETRAIYNAGSAGKCKGVSVEIDIKPGSFPNSINCQNRNGVVPVAVYTTSTFDATTVDPLTVRFGRTGTEAAEAHTRGHIEDVDGDGDLDLVLHFRFGETGIRCGDTQAMLTGKTFTGQSITGTDSIRTIGG